MALTSFHKKLLRVLAACVVIGFCVYFFRNVDWAKLGAALSEARWTLVALAAAINFVHLFLKAARWGVLLRPLGRVKTHQLFRYTLGSYAASNILPARAGEVLRVFYLRPHGIPAEGAVGVQMLEKVYEGVSLLVLCLPLALMPELPARAAKTIFVCTLLGLFGIGLMTWVALHHREKREGLLARLAEGVAILRQPRRALWAFVLSVVVWLTDAVEVMLVLAAVGISPSLSSALMTLVFINIAIAMPSTPGQVGAFEAGGVYALGVLGMPTERALAFAMIYHFMQAIPVTLAGMEALVLWRSMRKQPADTVEPAAVPARTDTP